MHAAHRLEFKVPFARALLHGSRWQAIRSVNTAVLLHGGGTSAADGFQELRTFLYNRNVSTVAFDFVGHGRTGGSQLGTTLDERVQQLESVLASQKLEPATTTLIGFSMGAYVAAKAVIKVAVPRLCLAIPAAYAAHAYKAPFGPQFTEILRSHRSWEQSDAFELMRHYVGHLLVVSAEEDGTIPAEIPKMYLASASNCVSTRHHVVSRSGHNLSGHYEREPQAREAVYSEIASLCRREA